MKVGISKKAAICAIILLFVSICSLNASASDLPVYSGWAKEEVSAAEDMRLLEDWGKGFCRLWTPITEKGNEHEQQLYYRPAQCPCGEVSLVHRYRDSEEPPSHEGGPAGV